jgi:hypothetical protein
LSRCHCDSYVDAKTVPVFYQTRFQAAKPRFLAFGFLIESSLAIRRRLMRLVRSFSPLKSTAGLPGSPVKSSPLAPFFFKLFCPAHASINVPPTVKFSSDNKCCARA